MSFPSHFLSFFDLFFPLGYILKYIHIFLEMLHDYQTGISGHLSFVLIDNLHGASKCRPEYSFVIT